MLILQVGDVALFRVPLYEFELKVPLLMSCMGGVEGAAKVPCVT